MPRGEARDDRMARRAELSGERCGHSGAQGGRVAGADERDTVGRFQQLGSTQGPEQRRRIGDGSQVVRVCRIVPADQVRLGGVACTKLGQGDAFGAGFVILKARRSRDRGKLCKGCRGAAVFVHKPEEGGNTDPAGAQQAEPNEVILFRGWRVRGVIGRHMILGRPRLRLLPWFDTDATVKQR